MREWIRGLAVPTAALGLLAGAARAGAAQIRPGSTRAPVAGGGGGVPGAAGGGGDGSLEALMFLVVMLVVLALLVLVIGSVLALPARLTGHPEFGFVAAVPLAIVAMWRFWDALHPWMVRGAEWGATGALWIAALMVVGFVLVLIANAFSRENVLTTLTVIAVAAGTFLLMTNTALGFWPALLISFAAACVVAGAWALVQEAWARAKRHSAG